MSEKVSTLSNPRNSKRRTFDESLTGPFTASVAREGERNTEVSKRGLRCVDCFAL